MSTSKKRKESSPSTSQKSRSISPSLRPVINFNSKVVPPQMKSAEKNFLYQQHFKEATNKSKITKYEKNKEKKGMNQLFGIYEDPRSYKNMWVNQAHNNIIKDIQTSYDDHTNYYDKHNGPIIVGSTPKKQRIIDIYTPSSTYYSPNENDRLVNESARTLTPIIVGARKKQTKKRKLRKTKRKKQNKRKSKKSRK